MALERLLTVGNTIVNGTDFVMNVYDVYQTGKEVKENFSKAETTSEKAHVIAQGLFCAVQAGNLALDGASYVAPERTEKLLGDQNTLKKVKFGFKCAVSVTDVTRNVTKATLKPSWTLADTVEIISVAGGRTIECYNFAKNNGLISKETEEKYKLKMKLVDNFLKIYRTQRKARDLYNNIFNKRKQRIPNKETAEGQSAKKNTTNPHVGKQEAQSTPQFNENLAKEFNKNPVDEQAAPGNEEALQQNEIYENRLREIIGWETLERIPEWLREDASLRLFRSSHTQVPVRFAVKPLGIIGAIYERAEIEELLAQQQRPNHWPEDLPFIRTNVEFDLTTQNYINLALEELAKVIQDEINKN